MLTPVQAEARAAALVDRARLAGAEAAEAVYHASASEAVQVRLGALEDVERSESEHIGLRVFIGQRSASIGSSDLGDDALAELAARAVAMAKLAPEDQFAGLAPAERLTHGPFPKLDLADPDEPSPAALRALAEAAEDAGRAVKGVTNSNGASASSGADVFALVTSHGFSGGSTSSSRSLSAGLIAGEGANMQRDYAWRSARYLSDLPNPEAIGAEAAERVLARLNPGKLTSGAMPVVFDPRVGGTLLGHLIGAISGSSIARRASFLLEHDLAQVFAPGISIIDDPLRPRGLASRRFDGEGLSVARRELVADGKLTGWLMDCASARQLGREPTGNAARGHGGAPGVSASNLHLAAGPVSRAELIADIAEGVLVTELIGQGVNGVTGDYSRGASGFRIVNGEVAGPVAEFTVAGNLLAMFAALVPASDLEWHRAINVPTIRIDGMTVAGD